MQGSLLRPGHRSVGSDGGGGVGAGGAFLGGVTPPGVAAGVGSFGTAAPMEGRSVTRTEGMGTGSREEIEALLVDGKKEEVRPARHFWCPAFDAPKYRIDWVFIS